MPVPDRIARRRKIEAWLVDWFRLDGSTISDGLEARIARLADAIEREIEKVLAS